MSKKPTTSTKDVLNRYQDGNTNPDVVFNSTNASPQNIDSLKRISLKSIFPTNFNVRKESLNINDEFVESIRKEGLLQPIRVIKDPSTTELKYLVLQGNRRLAALKIIHGENSNISVPCFVGWNNNTDNENLIKHIIAMSHENIHREDLSHKQQFEMIDDLQRLSRKVNHRKYSLEELSDMLCLSISAIKKILTYESLSDSEKEYAENHLTKSASQEFAMANEDVKAEIMKDNVKSTQTIREIKKKKKDKNTPLDIDVEIKRRKDVLDWDHFRITIDRDPDYSLIDCLSIAFNETKQKTKEG